ncbi:hypothetical protein LINPERHAP2_LOCUS35448 [Linum perenne]
MSRKLPQLWAKKGSISVSDVGFGFYIVRFETVADFDRAMFGGPWMINDHYVVIQEWRPYFRPEETFLSTLRVWVRLPGLPFEYFDNSVLKIIGDRIGRTVRIDHTTLEGSRGNFARICVEVDLSKPLLSKYRLRRRVRRIEYEGLHVICFNCGCYGHKDEACKQEPEAEIVQNQSTVFANPVFQREGDPEIRPEVEEDFGPWMQVKKNRRKQKQVVTSTTNPTGVAASTKVNGKGNSFSVLADKESEEILVADSIPKVTVPLEGSCKADSAGTGLHCNKENVDPLKIRPTPSNPPVQHSASINSGRASEDKPAQQAGISARPGLQSGPKPLSEVNNADPSVINSAAMAIDSSEPIFPIFPSNVELNASSDNDVAIPSSSLLISSPSDGVSKVGPQSAYVGSRGSIPLKNSKISKYKTKDSVGALGMKIRDVAQRSASKSSSSAMEEM